MQGVVLGAYYKAVIRAACPDQLSHRSKERQTIKLCLCMHDIFFLLQWIFLLYNSINSDLIICRANAVGMALGFTFFSTSNFQLGEC